MKRFLALLVAFAVAALPVAASALEPVPESLAYDDGSFELPRFLLNTTTAPVVQFDFPASTAPGVYALDRLWFYLEEETPSIPAPLSFPVTVQIWEEQEDPLLGTTNWVAMDPIVGDVTADDTGTMPGWYYLDLEGMNFAQAVRVGVHHDATLPPLHLGSDSVSTMPFGHSLLYDPAAAGGPWPPLDPPVNHGIRATVHFVPAMSCRGFLPPFNRTISMKWGGRTIPLKAFLSDSTGEPLTSDLLATPPVVEMYLVDSTGAILEDKTSDVGAPGRSNSEQFFRNTHGGQWRYNLKTKKSLSSGTYMVRLVSGDASEYVIDPTTCTATLEVTKGLKTPKVKNK